jgi:hypothetical protein
MIYGIKERDEGLSGIKLGLGLAVGAGVGDVKIVFNRAEMTIYSVYSGRSIGCLCRTDRSGGPPHSGPTGSDCYAPAEPIGKQHFVTSPQAIQFNITFGGE